MQETLNGSPGRKCEPFRVGHVAVTATGWLLVSLAAQRGVRQNDTRQKRHEPGTVERVASKHPAPKLCSRATGLQRAGRAVDPEPEDRAEGEENISACPPGRTVSKENAPFSRGNVPLVDERLVDGLAGGGAARVEGSSASPGPGTSVPGRTLVVVSNWSLSEGSAAPLVTHSSP